MINTVEEATKAANVSWCAGQKEGQAIGKRASAARIKELERQLADMDIAYGNAVAQCNEQLRELKVLRKEGTE